MTKTILKYSGALLLTVSLAISGCKKLDDMNRDPTKPSTTQPQYLLTGAQKSAMDVLYSGLQNGFIGMHYAQYWSGNARVVDSQYQLDEGNNGTFWNNLYRISLHDLDALINMNKPKLNEPGVANQTAIAHIMRAWIFQILADTYGNIPYSQAFQNTTNIAPAYDDAKTVYNSLIDILQAQIKVLDATQTSFNTGDIIYKGDVESWKRLGHSLLLRLAIRMADADPQKAKAIIEANYQQAISSNDQSAQFQYLADVPNRYPQNDVDRPIIDFAVSTTLLDYMNSLNDPRLPIYARPTADGNVFRGLPYGWATSDPDHKGDTYYSAPGKKVYSATMPGILMSYAEVEFILAEAAARGMNVGDAATHYTNGIKASMTWWRDITSSASTITDTAIDEYIAKVPYVAADWRNVIGTQKWLALYPQGFQAWFERTRLKFKKPGGAPLFMAPKSGVLDNSVKDGVPYRLTYPITEQSQNTANYNSAATAIGGDFKGTKLWYNKF
ncbi:SusD/RagB family nutrient-binding outer membrane lipoprotein [Chitinophaga polysaccharea]|uniref:SusD/RagB family nutrient-binding outer membrane lipoprotein n=1 Tax=Chitinophaga TaxID=79328 RepID=UPI001455CA0C|nr:MULTISPECIES: SusD/RagB family nutrient-binding outer membrane lipoprotein [Chitinophaga]NLR61590.1 SusD/RagB family nutrient-binding outer membrane lipoprotein [Chitinophaga polysaccharea]NLU93815.1 SusD/RagB family nutrient-binding outer membrane lipoprotein [Chitinophaga sp. Ak27]